MTDQFYQFDDRNLETDRVGDKLPVPVPQQLLLLAVILLLVFGVGLLPRLFISLKQPEPETPAAAIDITELENETLATDPFAELEIAGEAAFVFDTATQRVLYQKNPDEQLPLASITKLMTALVAQELLDQQSTVPITQSAIQQDGNSGFATGDQFDLKTLTDLTLLASSNDGAFAIAAAAGAVLSDHEPVVTFVDAMNIRAKELELTQTYYRNPTGLDISETEAGAYGSARDVAFLMEYILTNQPHLLELTSADSVQLENAAGEYYDTHNTNESATQIAGLIGSKTGYTELAGGNLAVAFNAGVNHPVIVVVLGSTLYGRFADTLSLVDAAREVLK